MDCFSVASNDKINKRLEDSITDEHDINRSMKMTTMTTFNKENITTSPSTKVSEKPVAVNCEKSNSNISEQESDGPSVLCDSRQKGHIDFTAAPKVR